MEKHVIVMLEYDMGDYSDLEISLDPKDWHDSFYQADINLQDLDIVGVKIEEK